MNTKWEETKQEELTEKAEAALTFYMEELSDVEELKEEEEKSLFSKLLEGDSFAKQRFVEGNLKQVIRVAAPFIGKGIPLADLIQEGNVALVMAVEQYNEQDLKGFKTFVEKRILDAMQAMISEEEQEEITAKKIADRANLLSEVSKNLADELGREATAEEMAERLSTTVDDVKEIMKISLDALSVMTTDGNEGIEEE